MLEVIEYLRNALREHSIPNVLVLVGIILLLLPFAQAFTPRDISPSDKKWARIFGVLFLVIGLVLTLVIQPGYSPQQQPQVPVYSIPYVVVTNTPDTTRTVPLIENHDPQVIQQSTPNYVPTVTPIISVPTATPTHSPTSTPTIPPPTSTPTPELVTQVVPVWAFEENGVRIDITASGVYDVAYLGDAYSPWPNEQDQGYRGWTTILRIYVNRSIKWGQTDYGLIGPIEHDGYLGPGEYYLDREQAITKSRGDHRKFRLNAGDYLTLVTLDEQGRYADNQGKIDVGITYLGP